MSQLKSNSLTVSAEQVRVLVQQSEALAQESIDVGIEAGQLLVQAKLECKHGEWLPFLARARVPERKAQRLMQLARAGLTSDTVTELGGVKAALELLSHRRLPKRGEALSITIHSQEDNPFHSVLASLVWPSTTHVGHFFVAGFRKLEVNEHSSVIFTKRAVSGDDVLTSDGRIFNPVWTLVERNIPVGIGNWHFHSAPQGWAELLAEKLGVSNDRTHLMAA